MSPSTTKSPSKAGGGPAVDRSFAARAHDPLALRRSGRSRLVFAALVAIAAFPVAGWTLSLAWFGVTLCLIAGEQSWLGWPKVSGRAGDGGVGVFSWLLSAGYALAAFYLVAFHTGVAQTLGVTLFGVTMFQILVADHTNPRRLLLNLIPPALALVAVQAGALVWRLQIGRPLEIITLLASPAVVFLVFRSIQDDLARSRRSLIESESRFRMLADHCSDLIVWMSLDGTVLYASPSAANFGYSPKAVIGTRNIDYVHPDDRERAIAITRGLVSGDPVDPTVRREYRFLTAWGQYIWLEGSPAVIRDRDGRPTSFVTSFRDITQRRQLETDLMDAKARAEAASEAKAAFLANMSHEIRTPLTAIIGFSALLAGLQGLPQLAATYARRISTGGQGLLTVVNDILDYSKLDAGQVELDPRPFDAAELFEDTISLFSGQAAEKGLDLTLEVEGDLPASLVADGARLRQVLANLLSNAVKFTESGRVHTSVRFDAAAGRLEVAVSDTGSGIPEEKLGRLFQRFSQVDGSISRQHGGTGLGLSICRSLVELMGGEITVTSAADQGSAFRFWVLATAVAGQPGETDPESRPGDEDLAASHVLVVDDLDVNRELIRTILEAVGHSVTEAAGGSEAVQAALDQPFDLILMDLQMPGMDGIAATTAIRSLPSANRHTPVIALSANVLPEHREATAAAGMNDHIGKPISTAELLGVIARWSGQGTAAPAAAAAG